MFPIGVFQKLFGSNEILRLRAVLHSKSMVKRDWYVWLKYLISLPQTDVKWEPEDYSMSVDSDKATCKPREKTMSAKKRSRPTAPSAAPTGVPAPAMSHLRRVWRKKMLFDRLPVPAPALPPLLSLELAAAELELSCIARSTLGATESTPST